jgi:hypothetical protein
MIIRLHFVQEGEKLDPRSVTSRSPRVSAEIRKRCAELIILPDGPETGSLASKETMAKRANYLEETMPNDNGDSGNVVDFTPNPAPPPTLAEQHTAVKAEIAAQFDRLQSLPPDQQLAQLVQLVRQALDQQADQVLDADEIRAALQQLIECLMAPQRSG